MNPTITRSNYQFVIDEIPENQVDCFLKLIDDFRNKTDCRFRYKNGKSVKYPLHIVPNYQQPLVVSKQQTYQGEDYIVDYEGM
tara:strand:+ start:2830 stop:3078 length:249 start_codon:yes stop_codon:yes gene_type:complete